MDFSLPPDLDALRLKVRAFVRDHAIPLEADPANFDAHENIRLDRLETLRAHAKQAGLWAPQAPVAWGGMGLSIVGRAAFYEEANYGLFGPVAMNCAAPDDGNMSILARVGTEAQKQRWLKPIVDGEVRSSFAMTEPAPGDDPDTGGAEGGRMVDPWTQMVYYGCGGSEAFHSDRPHLRRCAKRANGVSV